MTGIDRYARIDKNRQIIRQFMEKLDFKTNHECKLIAVILSIILFQ